MCKTIFASLLLATSLLGTAHATCPPISDIKASFASANNAPPNNEGFKYDAVDSDGNAWSGQYFHEAEDILKYNLKLVSLSASGDTCLYKGAPQRDQYGDEVFIRELKLTKQ